MKEEIKKILHWSWFKILIILAIFIFLLIQWGNFNVRRLDAYTNCRKAGYTIESCQKGFSISRVLFLR